MKPRIMKYVGIAIMILAHPVGFFFWKFLLLGPLYGNSSFEWSLFAALQGVGILEFFLVGLSLFVIGIVKSKDK